MSAGEEEAVVGRGAVGNPSQLLLHLIVSLQHLLQLGRDLLEESDLSAQVLLHLAPEVTDPGAVEVLDLSQCGTRDDVAAFMELALLLGAVLHLGQCTLQETNVMSDLVCSGSDLFKFKGVITCVCVCLGRKKVF